MSSSSSSSSKKPLPGVLAENKYGKNAVKFLRVYRNDAAAAAGDEAAKKHEVVEWNVRCQLIGDFETAFTVGSNEHILPTDTVKNTCIAFSKKLGRVGPEQYAWALADHFFATQPQVSGLEIEVNVLPWDRVSIGGRPHNHAFTQTHRETRSCIFRQDRNGIPTITQGITNLVVMKTTQSGFEGYPKDKFTSLGEVRDRIMCTNVVAKWELDVSDVKRSGMDFNFCQVRDRVEKALVEQFCGPPVDGVYSPSVQQTIYDMGQESLRQVSSMKWINIVCPNLHYLPFDLARFGMENKNEVFVPAYEPHGLIEATIRRKLTAKL